MVNCFLKVGDTYETKKGLCKKSHIRGGALTILASLSACINREEWASKKFQSEDELSDACAQGIVERIEAQDVSGLKDLFSKQALSEIDTDILNSEIEKLMSFYQGKMTECTGTSASSSSNDHGVKTLELVGYYTVVTDQRTYELHFFDCATDDTNADNIGVYMFELVSAEANSRENFNWTNKKNGPGVFIQE